jgi:hypothetical protein
VLCTAPAFNTTAPWGHFEEVSAVIRVVERDAVSRVPRYLPGPPQNTEALVVDVNKRPSFEASQLNIAGAGPHILSAWATLITPGEMK